MKFSNAKRRSGKHAMLHGAPKSGKSKLVGKLAEAGYHLWWLSTDGGHDVLSTLSPAAQERIELIHLKDTRNFPVAATTVTKIVRGGLQRICDEHGQINCSACARLGAAATWVEIDINKFTDNDILVIDHISGVAESVINSICAKDFQKNETYKFTWDDYRSQGSVMHDILSHIQHSPANVICIAHTLEVTSEDKSKILVPEVGTRNFSDTVGKYFDHIAYLHILNGGHRSGSSTIYRPGVLTGSRGDVAIENLTATEKDPAILAKLFSPLIVGQAQIAADSVKKLLVDSKSKVEEVRNVEEVDATNRASVGAVSDVLPTENVSLGTNERAGGDSEATVSESEGSKLPETVTGAEEVMTADQRMKALLASMRKGT